VITANKDLIAENYKELLNLAQQNNVNLNYEASVGGGIPILKTIKNNLKGNHIQGIYGIINGTTNFILSQMYDNNMNYDEVLKIAQDKGFAEADPTSDVEGLDASRKLAILSMLTFDVHIPWKKIKTEGITKIDKDDINYAKQLDKKIKLLGISKLGTNGIYASVRPVYIHKQNAISKIDNEFNGIYLESPLTGDLMFYGKGAGKFPTASAIFGDLLDIIQHIEKRDYYYMFKDSKLINYYPEKTNWFVRIKTNAIAESTNEIFSIFKNYKLDLKTNNDGMEITIKIYDVFEETLVEKLKELSTQESYKYFLILNDGDTDVNH
jgi:homoserine dehydrogenase